MGASLLGDRTLDQRHERHRPEALAVHSTFAASEAHQLLLALRADGYDHAAIHRELFEQRVGHSVRCCGDEDAVEGRLARPAERAVTVTIADVANVELLEAL